MRISMMKHPVGNDCRPASEPGAVLTVEGIAAGYAGARRTIHDVSFTVREGERIAVIGPNGAGKSTLFKTLVGIIPHTEGQISLHGESCRASHNMIGYVPQQARGDWRFPATVWDVVMMGRTREIGWFRWPGKRDRQIVEDALVKVGMLAYRSRQIDALSGGQRQRVFIARALAQETDVLLLDEPFNGVDVTAEDEIMNTLERLQAMGITILIATHDLMLAATRFDRVLVLNRQVIAYDVPDVCFSTDILSTAYGRQMGVMERDGQMLLIPAV